MPLRFVAGMTGFVVSAVTWTSGARPSRAASKSWLLQASTWARAMATAGDSVVTDMVYPVPSVDFGLVARGKSSSVETPSVTKIGRCGYSTRGDDRRELGRDPGGQWG